MLDERYHQTSVELAREGLSGTSPLRLQVTSESMQPMLRPGDVVVLEAIQGTDLKRGDIVVVQAGPTFVTHRLIGVNRDGYQTKGDQLAYADVCWSAEQIVGRVIAIERGGDSIDLRLGRRVIGNRVAGLFSRLESQSWAAGRRIKSNLFGSRSPARTLFLGRLLTWPFHILMRLALWFEK